MTSSSTSAASPRRLLHRSCREAAALMVAREDRPLAWNDRLALWLHLYACRTCPRFAAQLRFMREAFGRWRRSAAD